MSAGLGACSHVMHLALTTCDTPVIWDPRSWLRVAVPRGRYTVTVTVTVKVLATSSSTRMARGSQCSSCQLTSRVLRNPSGPHSDLAVELT